MVGRSLYSNSFQYPRSFVPPPNPVFLRVSPVSSAFDSWSAPRTAGGDPQYSFANTPRALSYALLYPMPGSERLPHRNHIAVTLPARTVGHTLPPTPASKAAAPWALPPSSELVDTTGTP